MNERTITPEQDITPPDENDRKEIQLEKVKRKKKTLGLDGKSPEELKQLAMKGYYVRDVANDRVFCPRGMILRRKSVKKDGTIRYSNKMECRRCNKREKCTVSSFKIVEFREGQEYSLCKKWNEPENDPS